MFSNEKINHIRLYYLLLLSVLFISFFEKSVYYLFFTNTLLAYIPIELTFLILKTKKSYFFFPMLLLWFAFLPNNFYLVTDLFHLSLMDPYDHLTLMISTNMSNWFKLLIIFLSIFSSVLFGCWSIDLVTNTLVKRLKERGNFYLVLVSILFLNSIGVYLGRFVRLNSWDFFQDASYVVREIIDNLYTQQNNWNFIALFLVFSLLLMIVYYLFKYLILSEGEEKNENTNSRR